MKSRDFLKRAWGWQKPFQSRHDVRKEKDRKGTLKENWCLVKGPPEEKAFVVPNSQRLISLIYQGFFSDLIEK